MAYNEHKSESQNNYGWNLTWNATGKFPIIAKRIWKTKTDLEAWVNDASDTAVEGLIVGVCGDGENNGVYFLESVGDGMTDGSVVQLVKTEKGKGLSTNDFTDEYKNKLDSYSGETGEFDDTAIWERIEELATVLETLTSENVDSAIESFNEIVNFLSNIEDTQTLDGIINGINQSISRVEKKIPTKLSELDNDKGYLTEHQNLSGKQDKLVSGTNIKTINGQDILGEGDIVIEGGNSEANVGAVDTDDFVEEPDLAKYLTTKPQSFTDEEKQQVKDNLGISAEDFDLSDYATKEELKGKEDKKVLIDHGTDDTTYALTPNVFHVWGEVASLALTLAEPTDSTVYNEYMFEFISGTTATTLELPDTIQWVSTPSVEANTIYQCSIVNNVGIIVSSYNL